VAKEITAALRPVCAVHQAVVVEPVAPVVQQQVQATPQELAAQLEMAFSTHSTYQERVRST
jgi:hypothetical protein